MKTLAATLGALVSLTTGTTGFSASIIWVSDQLPIGSGTSDNTAATGIFGSGAGPYPDQGIVNLLTAAGHTVTRFNPSDANPLSATDLTTLNAANLVIIGRSIASASFDTAAETLAWNTGITKPLIATNTYMTRASRLGWFVGSTQPDQVLNPLTFTNPANPVQAFIIGSTAMTGSTTTNSITHAVTYANAAVDIRGISEITDAPVAGATEIANTSVAAATGRYIVSFPAGTAVGTGAGSPSVGQVLGGYRMQFLVANRESADAPNNVIGSAGFENLTAEGEAMFLRAVTVALNNGAIPEPATATLLLLAGGALMRRRRAA
jgi:hypothetical protein